MSTTRAVLNVLLGILLMAFCVIQQWRINSVERELGDTRQQLIESMHSVTSILESHNRSLTMLGEASKSNTHSIELITEHLR